MYLLLASEFLAPEEGAVKLYRYVGTKLSLLSA
jgi:hypothetical protein